MDQAFRRILSEFTNRPSVSCLLQGQASLNQYGAFMRQVFHQARENPQLQAYATAYFRGSQRQCVKRFFQHATSEIGHDFLALNDLRNLGISASGLTEGIPNEHPLPETQALTAFAYHQIQFVDPIGYLGYLYFLEFMPTSIGGGAAIALDQMGVPGNARTFINDHITIDVAHNKMMDGYLELLVRTERDLAIAIAAMQATGRLYGNMIEAAFEIADDSGLRSTALAESALNIVCG